MKRRSLPFVALALTAALTVGGLAAPAGAGAERKVTLFPVSVTQTDEGSVGGAHPVTIRLREGGGDQFRVGFTEDEVGGTGDQWRAAGWNAATVATLLTGSDLGGNEITYDLNGRIDGPSAGALMTIGTIALLRGDKIKKDITMTGTINPDGTVGPVGGIPYKVDGAVEANKKRMLIPLGQRNVEDDLGNVVDIVDLGVEKDIEVQEVGDIYEAYEEFTGKELPRPQSNADPELSSEVYDKLEALVNEWLSEFDAQAGQFNSLDPAVQNEFLSIAEDANAAQQRAVDLSQQGLQAGAYSSAIEAAALARAGVVVGRAFQTLQTQGIDAFASQIEGSAAVSGKVDSLLDTLKSEKPRTLTDASALIDGYSNAFDALAFTDFADEQFNLATVEDPSPAITAAVFYEFARTIVEAADQLIDLTRGGARVKQADIDPEAAADFFRKAAEANFNAFDAVFIEPQAASSGVSGDQVRSVLASNDFDYALAEAGVRIVESENLEKLLGGGRNAAFGDLGASVNLYVRTNSLLTKYYSLVGLSCMDETFEPVCTKNERSLLNALDFAEAQLESGIGLLVSKNVDPTPEVGSFEIAGVSAEGDIAERLEALDTFLSAFIKTRILAYLGAFPKAGLE
jgi:hypothetical protein